MRKEKGSALGDEKQGNAQVYAHIHTITLVQTVRGEHRDLHLLISEELYLRCFPIYSETLVGSS